MRYRRMLSDMLFLARAIAIIAAPDAAIIAYALIPIGNAIERMAICTFRYANIADACFL